MAHGCMSFWDKMVHIMLILCISALILHYQNKQAIHYIFIWRSICPEDESRFGSAFSKLGGWGKKMDHLIDIGYDVL